MIFARFIKKHTTLAHQASSNTAKQNTAIQNTSAMCNNSNTQEKESRNYNSMHANK